MNREVADLFHELVDLTPAQRESYFLGRTIAPDVRLQVESLLSFDSGDEHLLTEPVAQWAEQLLHHTAEPQEETRCGPYRLLRLLGRGGMGSVFLAERVDGEVEQRVAIKFLRLGGDERAFRDRFLRERQILATLNHPGIAGLLDAGHTADGQPYLAMDYIDGTPIDVYAAGLDVRDKLRLFLKVCEAISYAHRNLIIHRDLKPSNILVDSSGEPKLLDFGIAKILDATSDQTMTQDRVLTPAFASPEQVRGAAQATTSDVYSLGAVLYMLLTGRSPHDISAQNREAIDLAVCLTEPVAPSRVNAALPKDLDFIILKALRKEPEARYRSAAALADDIQAFLESRPVQARSGNAWYRTQKFLRRYWVPVMATAVVLVSLSAALYVANRERVLAQRRFMEVRQVANRLFEIDALAKQLPGSTKTRQLIVDTSLEYLGRLSADVHGDVGLALEVGNAYLLVGQVQGVPVGANLGQVDKAEQSLRLADGFVDSVLAAQPSNRTALLRSAQIAHCRMILADGNRRLEEANNLARKSSALLERFNAQKSDQVEAPQILTTYLNIAARYDGAQLYDDALAICRRGGELSQIFGRPASRGTFLRVAARVYRVRGDLDKALESIQESVKLLEPGPDNTEQAQNLNFAMALVNEGEILGGENAISLGRPEEAVAALERAFQIADERAHQDPNDQNSRGMVEMAGNPLAAILRRSDAVRSLAVYDHTLRHLAEVKGNHTNMQLREARALAGSSYALRELGKPAEARQRLDRALKILATTKSYPADSVSLGSETDLVIRADADYEAAMGNVPRARQIYRELLERVAADKPDPENDLGDAVDMSGLYKGMAAVDPQGGFQGRQLELWRHWDVKLPHNAFVLRQLAATNSTTAASPQRPLRP